MDSAPQNRGPFIEEMTSFLNTFKAIPTPMMIMGYGGQMRSVACEALWKLANKIPIDINECSAMFHTDWTPIPAATSNVQNRYFSSATPIASSIAIDPDATTPMHVSARARKRIVLSDDEDSREEEVVAVSALFEDAGDDEMPLDAPVRGSESMGSNGDVLEAMASTSRATRTRNRAVRSTPYQRVQALLRQRAPAPATRIRGRPAMGDYEALSSVRRKPRASNCMCARFARALAAVLSMR